MPCEDEPVFLRKKFNINWRRRNKFSISKRTLFQCEHIYVAKTEFGMS